LCARAMARFKPFSIIAANDMPHALYKLPIEALEINARSLQTLHELGINNLLELFRLPRAQLLARFGTDLLDRIDMIRGDKNDPRIFEEEAQDWFIQESTYETIRDSTHLCDALLHILKRLCHTLSENGLGILTLETTFIHVDRSKSHFETSMVRPSCDPDKILRLLKLKLDAFDAGQGVESILVRANKTKKLKPQETTLAYANVPTDNDLSALIDTLFNRIGNEHVFRFSEKESHVPERSFAKNMDCFATLAMTDGLSKTERPVRILKAPEPIDVIAMLPDSPPKRILLRRHFVFHVLKANGPERIASEWWCDNSYKTRDYYSVENQNGLRLWVFKQQTTSSQAPKWFIHGLFA